MIESSKSRQCAQHPDERWFLSVDDTSENIKRCTCHYNAGRPRGSASVRVCHGSVSGWMPPAFDTPISAQSVRSTLTGSNRQPVEASRLRCALPLCPTSPTTCAARDLAWILTAYRGLGARSEDYG